MITVREARTEHDVGQAVAACWPRIQQGQAGFSLAGLRSPEALSEQWGRLLDHPAKALLLAENHAELVGACGYFASDAQTLQTVNGPIGWGDVDGVYAALFGAIGRRHPGAALSVGVSHRHRLAREWLAANGAVLREHAWPYEGPARDCPMPRGVRLVAADEDARFKELFDREIGQDLWWTASRILEVRDQWILLVDEGWSAILAARVYADSEISEVFASSAPDEATCTDLVRAWLGESARRGRPVGVYFCETKMERVAAAACGLTCGDEYFDFVLPL